MLIIVNDNYIVIMHEFSNLHLMMTSIPVKEG